MGLTINSHITLNLSPDQQADVGGAFLISIITVVHHVPKVIDSQMLSAARVGAVQEWTMLSWLIGHWFGRRSRSVT